MVLALSRVAFFCLCVAHIGCLLRNHVDAFVVPEVSISISSSTCSSTELRAFSSSRRREVFGNLKKAVFAGGLMGTFRREPALAEESQSPSPVTGRVVEFLIGNVGGEPGATGTVKIQLVRGAWHTFGTMDVADSYRITYITFASMIGL
jgi:hypothetical protein